METGGLRWLAGSGDRKIWAGQSAVEIGGYG